MCDSGSSDIQPQVSYDEPRGLCVEGRGSIPPRCLPLTVGLHSTGLRCIQVGVCKGEWVSW